MQTDAIQRADSVTISTAADHAARGGEIPASALHFRTGRVDEACDLVTRFHYSRRVPRASIIQLVGTLHLDGGLFGGDGEAVAAAIFVLPPTRWAEPVLELSRLVRRDGERPPLTFLISRCLHALGRAGGDLVVSFADRTQGHEGIVYRAAGWVYGGFREPSNDGILIDGVFHPGRSCNSAFGTRSADKLAEKFPGRTIEAHYDAGKRLYWKALGRRGLKQAERLGLTPLRHASGWRGSGSGKWIPPRGFDRCWPDALATGAHIEAVHDPLAPLWVVPNP